MKNTNEEIAAAKDSKMLQLFTQQSFLNYTRYHYREIHNRKFVINSHHELISDALGKVLSGEIKKLMINIAPRYGKTELAVKNFISHGLSLNPASKYIHLSYSDDLALDNSEAVKSIVDSPAYRRLYPKVRIKPRSDAKKKWYTTAGGGVYATAAAGQVTGFGAGLVDVEGEAEFENELDKMLFDTGINKAFGGALVIDDPIKPEDADSEAIREKVNSRYDSTIKNRVNSRNTPIVIIMQRLHERDLCGYLLENEPGEWTVLSLPCIIEEPGQERRALWPFKHTLEELDKLRDTNSLVFDRQYMQYPTPIGGRLYGLPWKLYHSVETLPLFNWKMKKAYIDTADLGTDYLCAIFYIETKTAMYVTNVEYRIEGMEVTEASVAKMIDRERPDLVRVESNNGGRGFARNIERMTREYRNFHTTFVSFHQTDNKYVRIFTNAASVQNTIYFPEDWLTRWPKFAKSVNSYLAAGDNAHDDAEDALTGAYEYFNKDTMQIAEKLANLLPG